MPAFTDTSSRALRLARAARSSALAAGAVLFGLAGPAQSDPGASAGASGGIQWETPRGLAGVDAYRLDFLGAAGLVPMAAPLAPLSPQNGRSAAPAPFEATAAPAVPTTETPAIRPVATAPLGGIDRQAVRGRGFTLSDAVRDAGWRKATAERLRRLAPSRPPF